MCLFEIVKEALGVEYISDLRFGETRKNAQRLMSTFDLGAFSAHELSDMAEYLYGEKKEFETAEQGIRFFRSSAQKSELPAAKP